MVLSEEDIQNLVVDLPELDVDLDLEKIHSKKIPILYRIFIFLTAIPLRRQFLRKRDKSDEEE